MDVNNESSTMLQKVCYIAHQRNILNHARSIARWKVNYYNKYLSNKKTHKKMSVSELRLKILSLKKEELESRVKIAELTLLTRKEMLRLLKILNLKVIYDNGYISCVITRNYNDLLNYNNYLYIDKKDFATYYDNYLLSKSIDEMLR